MTEKVFYRWVLPLSLLIILTCLIVFVYVPIYQKTNVTKEMDTEVYGFDDDQKSFSLENEELLFTIDAATTQFTVKNKKTGHEWRSNPLDVANDPLAVASEKEKLQAVFLLTACTAAGAPNVFNSYNDSVTNGVYSIEAAEDEIAVRYAVGKISKTYYVPIAITKNRMEQFTAGLSKSKANVILNMYKLYDPAKLKESEKDELLSLYPDLEFEPVYVMMPKQKDVAKARAEAQLMSCGYSREEYQYDLSRTNVEIETSGNVYNITMKYRLAGNDLIVEIPFDDIKYPVDAPVIGLSLLPYFGAAGTDKNGYVIVPEGGGAIIRNNNQKIWQSSYTSNVYGWDYAQDRVQLYSESRSAYPMFAATGDEDSFLCMLEQGASYARINAEIAGRINSYNYVYADYTIVHRDQFKVSSRTTATIYVGEESLPHESLVQRYRFLGTDDYIRMAKAYGAYLQESGCLSDKVDNEAPIVIDLLGAIDKTKSQMGILVRRPEAMTNFAQGAEMVEELNENGLEHLNIRYIGWANNGIYQQVFTRMNPVEALGGSGGLTSFINAAQAGGNQVYLDGMCEFAYDSGLAEGMSVFSDVAQLTTRERVRLRHFSPLTFAPDAANDVYYLVTPDYMLSMAKNFSDGAAALGADGLAYRDMGYMLSADYNPANRISREESIKYQRNALKYAADNKQKIMIRAGNLYALSAADVVTHMDITGTDYTILDEQIPFFQIAVHGRLLYTGKPLNMTGDEETLLLQSAEYGAGLAFAFMKAKADVLIDTKYTSYVSTNWDMRKDDAIQLLKRYRAEMDGLFDQEIIGYERLTAYVTCTEYENGARVYVNYGIEDAVLEGLTIPARDYLVKGGSAQ